MPNKTPTSEIINKKYGRLLIIEDLGSVKKCRRVSVLCDCGVIKDVNVSHLKNGSIVSCGCKVREETIARNFKHGLSKHPLNRVWRGMKERCYKKNHISYKWYGLKGVAVCDEWVSNFNVFYDWAIINGYKKGLVIDRINNNKPYSPDNCRWVTFLESNRNTTANRLIKMNGETKCVSQWCEELGIRRSLVSDRLNKLGWSIQKSFSMPANIKRNQNANKL